MAATSPPIPDLSYSQDGNSSTPIADLTYRNYDGPLHNRAVRWWTIALAMFKLHTKPLSFKIVAAVAVIPYLFTIALLWVQGQLNNSPGARPSFLIVLGIVDDTRGQRFALQFYNALGYQLLYLLILTVIAGAGSIASDNRNNALLIYLSKPITKSDYLLGKWFGLFLSLFMVAFGPALLLYMYCLCSYVGSGFLRDEPRLIWHVFESTAITAAVFTSVMIGLSAWSKSARITGAILAAVYFAGQAYSLAVWILFSHGDPAKNVVLQHCSIGGAISGLTKGIYGITEHMLRGNMRKGFRPLEFPPPPAPAMWGIVLSLIMAGVLAARAKIRAVEIIS